MSRIGTGHSSELRLQPFHKIARVRFGRLPGGRNAPPEPSAYAAQSGRPAHPHQDADNLSESASAIRGYCMRCRVPAVFERAGLAEWTAVQSKQLVDFRLQQFFGNDSGVEVADLAVFIDEERGGHAV